MGIEHGLRPKLFLELTDDEKNMWTDILLKYYQEKGKTEEESIEITKEKIKGAQIGWTNAPRSFRTRIMRKTGYGMEVATMDKARQGKVKGKRPLSRKVQAKRIIDNVFDYDIEDALSVKEKGWWEKRKKVYYGEFEFNDSSDYVLVQQLLVEELTQRRLSIKQLASPDHSEYSKLITESLRRLQDLQIRLGITRDQRAGELDQMEGNVAYLSMSLDEKLKNIEELREKETVEENKYMIMHNERPQVNILPPKEKIIAILGINQDGSSDLVDKKIDITEQIEKLHEKTVKTPEIVEHEE